MSNHNRPFITTDFLLGSSGSLDFCLASLKSLGCFYFRCILSSQWKAVTVNLQILHCNFNRIFEGLWSECVWQQAISCCWCYRMPQNAFPPHELTIFWSAKKNDAKTLFSTLHPLSWVIFATATAVAFVLL